MNQPPTSPTNPTPQQPATPPAEAAKARSYKDTLNLPKTAFAMKANLVQNEPASVKRWAAMKLYEQVRAKSKGKPKFVFHDGPPYANGNLHLGHLLNRCLKDFVVRSRNMMGFDCPFIPGWDCHGLPIEHKVMTDMMEKGKAAKLQTMPDDQRRMIVRRECQAHAEKYQKLQRGQMERFLTLADYEHPYLTMKPEFEGATLEVLADLMAQGLVFRALKPVHWSIANETALAEAELEYYDREDLSVYVDFEAADLDAVYDAFGLKAGEEDLNAENAESKEGGEGEVSKLPLPGTRPMVRPSFMIWTTTPWTLPANMGIAVNPKFEYACVWMDGAVTVVAADAVAKLVKMPTGEHKVENHVVLATCSGQKLLGLAYKHPFMKPWEDAKATVWKVVGADYVTLEDGTGLVHTAPGHGTEDYQTGLREGIPVYCPVTANGTYDAKDERLPEWLFKDGAARTQTLDIWAANPLVTQQLKSSGHLFFSHKFTHSYPHDWRSKTPVIFRCTEQWFVGVDRKTRHDGASLRDLALSRTDSGVQFVPEWGKNRMRGMLESRPDWCISRQRTWGLPIPAFFTPEGECFMTPAVVRAVAKLVREKGSDVWFASTPQELLKYYDAGSDPDAPAFANKATLAPLLAQRALKKGPDILDVWFESGSTWAGCLKERGIGDHADLYLEGSDQHRGWFQSSLLTCLGATGHPPYKTLLTHGFIVDKDGKKLSKSRPDAARYEVESLWNEFGIDVMRWWVASLPYENDIKADLAFFTDLGESYRKVRNTLRFMLSNLSDFAAPGVELASIPATSPDAWVLAQFDILAADVQKAYVEFDYRGVQQRLYDFCNDTLSAVYLVVVKDRLYCDRPDSARRRRTQTVLWNLTSGLSRLLAPFLCHTADEAYRELMRVDPKDTQASVHLQDFVTTAGKPGFGVKADARWAAALTARSTVMLAIDQARKAMGVDNPLDMGVTIPDPEGALAAFDPVDLADLLGVSRVSLDKSAKAPVVQDLRTEPRCDRSWKRDGTVKLRSDGGMLSDRDAEAVGVV